MAHVEWVETSGAEVWYVRTERAGWDHMLTIGSVTYWPVKQKYNALYAPLPDFSYQAREQISKQFDSLEEAHAWLMTLARME